MCTRCELGKYTYIVNSDCYKCPYDQWMHGVRESITFCMQCPPHTYQRQDGRQCVSCEAGKISDAEFQLCPAGMSSVQDTPCQNCNPGTFSPIAGTPSCQQSSAGKFQNASAGQSCHNASGYVSASGAMLLNTFLLQEQYSVVFLGVQLARQEESWEHCVLCVAGKCKNSAGSAECKDCVAGKYSTVVGAGSDLCQACPVNSVSMEGRDEFVDCQCNSGSTGANRGSCVLSRCIARKYKTNTGGAECTNCVAGK